MLTYLEKLPIPILAKITFYLCYDFDLLSLFDVSDLLRQKLVLGGISKIPFDLVQKISPLISIYYELNLYDDSYYKSSLDMKSLQISSAVTHLSFDTSYFSSKQLKLDFNIPQVNNITHLTINGTCSNWMEGYSWYLKSNFMNWLVSTFPRLKYIKTEGLSSLIDFKSLNALKEAHIKISRDNGLIEIPESLTVLSIDFSDSFDVIPIDNMVKWNHLHTLTLNYCHVKLRYLSYIPPNLTFLDGSFIIHLHNNDPDHIIEVDLRYLKKLVTLKLGLTKYHSYQDIPKMFRVYLPNGKHGSESGNLTNLTITNSLKFIIEGYVEKFTIYGLDLIQKNIEYFKTKTLDLGLEIMPQEYIPVLVALISRIPMLENVIINLTYIETNNLTHEETYEQICNTKNSQNQLLRWYSKTKKGPITEFYNPSNPNSSFRTCFTSLTLLLGNDNFEQLSHYTSLTHLTVVNSNSHIHQVLNLLPSSLTQLSIPAIDNLTYFEWPKNTHCPHLSTILFGDNVLILNLPSTVVHLKFETKNLQTPFKTIFNAYRVSKSKNIQFYLFTQLEKLEFSIQDIYTEDISDLKFAKFCLKKFEKLQSIDIKTPISYREWIKFYFRVKEYIIPSETMNILIQEERILKDFKTIEDSDDHDDESESDNDNETTHSEVIHVISEDSEFGKKNVEPLKQKIRISLFSISYIPIYHSILLHRRFGSKNNSITIKKNQESPPLTTSTILSLSESFKIDPFYVPLYPEDLPYSSLFICICSRYHDLPYTEIPNGYEEILYTWDALVHIQDYTYFDLSSLPLDLKRLTLVDCKPKYLTIPEIYQFQSLKNWPLPNLETLDLGNSSCLLGCISSPKILSELPKSLTRLSLKIKNSTKFEFLKSLPVLKSLKFICKRFLDFDISEDLKENLKTCTNLTRLDWVDLDSISGILPNTISTWFPTDNISMPSLQVLDLSLLGEFGETNIDSIPTNIQNLIITIMFSSTTTLEVRIEVLKKLESKLRSINQGKEDNKKLSITIKSHTASCDFGQFLFDKISADPNGFMNDLPELDKWTFL